MKKIITVIKDYFVGVIAETQKVTWPTRQQVINQTLVVAVATVLLASFFALVDFGFSKLVQFIINWRQ